MSWVRIESGFFRHRKVLSLKLGAKLLFIGGLCYSAENGTDGYVSKDALRVLVAELDIPRPGPLVADLEDAGLWHKDAGGWAIHDYLVYQPSAEQERQRRQETADRVKAWRETKKARRNAGSNAVTSTVTDHVRNGHVTLSPNPNPNPTTTSSSEEPLGDHAGEEEEPFVKEARKRLLTTTSVVVDPDAWVRAAARRLQAEGWQPATCRPPANCRTCNDLPLADPCPDCTRSATA